MKSNTARNRELLVDAQGKGLASTLGVYLRLSGPGWLQSAITLGGGSLGSALYLGVLGGTSMLWLNLSAIVVGVIMLTSISYVVLSTGQRPLKAINQHVNPVLGIGWVTATILANMIWVLPQFGLCFDICNKNLMPEIVKDTQSYKYGVSVVLFLFASGMVYLNLVGGAASKAFDILLKLIIGVVVISFVAVVVSLFQQGHIVANEVLVGLIPRPDQWFNPVHSVSSLLGKLPGDVQEYWAPRFIANQRNVMISTTATVVGVNMTFLLPYSMLDRGWDKSFRGLANFDLVTGLAIPFVLVSSCIVIASAYSFHGKADERFLSDDPVMVAQSPLFKNASLFIVERIGAGDEDFDSSELNQDQVAQMVAESSQEERMLAAMLVKPNTGQLAQSLEPLLGKRNANLVFGLGVFGMGFSTIIVLMMINGFAIAELMEKPNSLSIKMAGAILVGIIGIAWPIIWMGESKTWLIILASTFGAILLPIAYIAFFGLMNNRNLLGEDFLSGPKRWFWNLLMGTGVAAALAQAASSLYTKLYDPKTGSMIELNAGSLIVGGIITFALLALIGFSATSRTHSETDSSD